MDEWEPWDKDEELTIFGARVARVRDIVGVGIGLGQAADEAFNRFDPFNPMALRNIVNTASRAPAMLDQAEKVGKAILSIFDAGDDNISIVPCTMCAFDRKRVQYDSQMRFENMRRAFNVLNTNLNPLYPVFVNAYEGAEAYNRRDPIEAGRLWGSGALMGAYGAARGVASGLVGRTTLSGFSEIPNLESTVELENTIEKGPAVPPKIRMGDVKSIDDKNALRALSEMDAREKYSRALGKSVRVYGTDNSNTGLAMYDPRTGKVTFQVFGPAPPGQARLVIWEGNIGSVPIPQGVRGVNVGNALEELVRDLVRQATGQNFPSKPWWAHGPDLWDPSQ